LSAKSLSTAPQNWRLRSRSSGHSNSTPRSIIAEANRTCLGSVYTDLTIPSSLKLE
jgi:hypothetical protein